MITNIHQSWLTIVWYHIWLAIDHGISLYILNAKPCKKSSILSMLGFRHHDHGPMNIGHLGEPIYLSIYLAIYLCSYLHPIPSHTILCHTYRTSGVGFYAPMAITSPTYWEYDLHRYGCEAGDVISKSPIVGTSIPTPGNGGFPKK